jgi:SanA protein
MNRVKRYLRIISLFALVFILLGSAWSLWVSHAVKPRIYNLENLPKRHAGLLLGTSKYVKKGKINQFYEQRIEAASLLYTSGKVDYLIVSGDNATLQYNEPVTMMKDLRAKGVPEERIFQDFAGFRTLDSMVRSNKVFLQNEVTVISQKFHVERALFLASSHDIDAIGFCAGDVPFPYGIKTQLREFFARIKMFSDLYIFRTKPRFLGEPVHIPS